jgi:hypothetical protein
MSSTLSDHLASDETAADAVDCVPGAIGESHDVILSQPPEASPRAKSTESGQRDCCPACGEQFAELQSRIGQIERQLEELLAGTCAGTGQSAVSELEILETVEDSAEGCEDAATNDEPAAAEDVAEPAYTAHLIGEGIQTPASPAERDDSDSASLPTWTEAYQNDDVDESVRDYVEQLLRRMGTESDEEPVPDKTTVVAKRVEKPWVPSGRTEAATDVSDEKADRSVEVESPAHASPPATTSQPVKHRETLPVVENNHPTDGEVAPKTPASHDPANDLIPDSPGCTSAESYSPRSLPPERLANLNELRELANISATAAIRTFEKGRAAKNAVDRLPLIMVGLSCGLFLLYFATTCDNPMMQILLYAGVGLSFLAATGAAGQALSVLFCWLATARQANEPRDDAPDDSAEHSIGDV